MTFFKKLALVASLAVASLGSAHAAGTTLPMDAGAPGDFENSWSFKSLDFGETGPKGTTFADYFLFNVPDDEYVSFNVFSSSVTFKSAAGDLGFILYGLGGSPFIVDVQTGSTAHSIEGGTYKLTSGVYELDLFGKFTSKNGTYDLTIFGTPVPEPTNVALMLAGLGAVGLMARRRKQQA